MSRQIPLDDVISTIRKKFEVPSTLTSAHRLYFKTKDNKQMHLCDLKDKITLTNSGYGSEDVNFVNFVLFTYSKVNFCLLFWNLDYLFGISK